MKRMTAGIALMSLAACATTSDYQFGDVSKRVLEYQLQYCATANPYQRAVALAVLQNLSDKIPDRGLCTDLASALLAGQLPEVDTAGTEADREWARKMLGEGDDE